jgi:hypothetical protein
MPARLILTASIVLHLSLSAENPWHWKQDGQRSIELRGPTGPVARFLVDPKPADPHFDVLATADGRNMVWVAPPDHVWHYGHWFSWKIINGVNFWETDRTTGQSKGRTEVLDPGIDTTPDRATVSYRRLYRLPGVAGPIMEDRVTITIHPPAGKAGPTVDWRITTTALADLTLDRTPLPGEPGGKSWGGYCGFSWRGAKGLKDLEFTDSKGRKNDAIHRQHAAWVNARGTLDGKAAGIALLSHPDNPGHPMSWYILAQPKLPFWYANPSPVQPKPIALKRGQSLAHRYRIVPHDGSLQARDIKW